MCSPESLSIFWSVNVRSVTDSVSKVSAILILFVAASISAGSISMAQSKPIASVSMETEKRIRDIYQRNLYQAKKIQAEWLPDSSGFFATQTDPVSGKQTRSIVDARTGEASEITDEKEKAATSDSLLSPDGLWRIQKSHRELGVRSVASQKTDDSGVDKASEYTVLLQASESRDVHFRNTQWSPDGEYIVFVEADLTDVPIRQVLVSEDPSYPRLENHRFARVGEKIESLRVGVIARRGGDVTWLDLQAREEGFYLGQIAWTDDSQEILVEKFSRFRDSRDVYVFRLDGTSRTIFSERSSSWVESSQGKITGIEWVDKGKKFVVVSESDGWRHAFLYDRTGQELALLTSGDYDVIDRGTIDEESGSYYFYASPENGTQRYLFRVPLDGSGNLERITPEKQLGTHHYQFSPNGKVALHTYSAIDSPPVVELVELPTHRVVKVLEDNSDLRERMKSILHHTTEFLALDMGNGFHADAWMIKPRDFDPTKKYPVFVYVYGEPHLQTVLDEWAPRK